MSTDAENQINSSQPSFFAVIHANVRYNKKLEHGAKLLFAELTCLANQYGYSWASNKYFMDVYDVSETTIQNWLRSLKNEGMIKVVVEKNGMVSSRKIYIANFPKDEEIKENSATLRNLSPRHSENDTLDTQKSECIIDNNTEYITEHNKVVVVNAREGAAGEIKLQKNDVHLFSMKFKKGWTSEEIDEAWKRYTSSSSLVEDVMKYIEGIINKIRINNLHKTNKEKDQCQKKRKYLKEQERLREHYSEKDMSEAPLAKFARQSGLRY